MSVSYRKLREIMHKRDIQYKYLKIESRVNHDTLAKIKKDEYISLSALEKIAIALDVEIGDLVEIKKPRKRGYYGPDIEL